MRLKEQPKISVIVPVYNVEKYLRQCLDSIVDQTFEDIEIIVLNDGSTDGSLGIVNEYVAKDKRIKVIDKPNEGLGKTYNRGIEAATGEYIGFVESDDWIELDMYEVLHGIAKTHDVDVVKSSFIRFDDETCKDDSVLGIPEHIVERVLNPRQNPEVFILQSSVWSAIYKREFLNEHNIRFLESPGASYQDTAFNFKVWAMAKKVYLTTRLLVHYRTGHFGQSIKSKNNVFCVCDEFKEIERYMATYPTLFGKLEMIFNRVKFNLYQWNLDRLDGENREAFRGQMQSEFAPVLKRNAIDLTGITSKNRLKMWKTLGPRSAWLKTRYILGNLTRWLVKDMQRDGFMEIRILFGIFLIAKKTIVYQGVE